MERCQLLGYEQRAERMNPFAAQKHALLRMRLIASSGIGSVAPSDRSASGERGVEGFGVSDCALGATGA